MVAAKPLSHALGPPARTDEVDEIEYPASDGLPMSDNMKQWQRMVEITENLDLMLPDLVAGNNLWYPVEGRPDIRMAPDVYVALRRPKGPRSSYLQWKEDNVPLTVVFEILSPSNNMREMIKKGMFYERYGAREFIVIDPEAETGWAFIHDDRGGIRQDVPDLDGWTSPTLGIRFAREGEALRIYRPDGTPFMTFAELDARAREAERLAAEASQRAEEASQRAEEASQRAEREAQRAEEASQRAEREAQRARRLADQLAALGVDPDTL